jgi:hypothetical protein
MSVTVLTPKSPRALSGYFGGQPEKNYIIKFQLSYQSETSVYYELNVCVENYEDAYKGLGYQKILVCSSYKFFQEKCIRDIFYSIFANNTCVGRQIKIKKTKLKTYKDSFFIDNEKIINIEIFNDPIDPLNTVMFAS